MSRLKASRIIKAIDKAIALNPTNITFTKTVKKEVDGAFEDEVITCTIKVLIYVDESMNSISITSDKQGTSYVSDRYKMIANKDSNLDTTPTELIDLMKK